MGTLIAIVRGVSHRPPRLQGFSYLGLHRYFLTFCTYRRQRLFTTSSIVDPFLEQISNAAQRDPFAILAYCFMPDHLHLLVEASSCPSDLIAFAHAMKQRTSYTHRRSQHELDLWQKGYYEHVIRDDESTQTIAKYVLENPVRAGLVKEPLAYPFSGSLVFTRQQLIELWQAGTP